MSIYNFLIDNINEQKLSICSPYGKTSSLYPFIKNYRHILGNIIIIYPSIYYINQIKKIYKYYIENLYIKFITVEESIEYLFDKYFVNNHLFIVPTENYSFIEYNTKTLRVERHIIHKKIINVNYNIDDTCYTDMKITYNNYKIIKTFENNSKPVYKYCLPEDISFFNYIYCEYGDYDNENSKIYALSDEYIYYIYIQN